MKTKPLKPILTFLFLFLSGIISAQNQSRPTISMEPFEDSMRHWYGIRDADKIISPRPNQPRYPESEIEKIADNILIYQRNNGGWPKNYDLQAILSAEQTDSLIRTKHNTNTTFDNSTTYTHIAYLAKVFEITKIDKYRQSCLKGLQFIVDAQFKNGGWPQYFPLEKNKYSTHITLNDGAYIGIMTLLKQIADNRPEYNFIDSKLRNKLLESYRKGLECLLKMQIVDNGQLTAWCQQHDEVTLLPAWARAFEPPSICNGESSGVVLFLMSIDHPDQRIIQSVQAAVKWFHDSEILNTRMEVIHASAEESQWKTITTDKVVVTDPAAPPIWTRYYELGSHRSLFCDRNSKYLYSLAEVSRERRAGYAWYTYAPQEVLDRYPEWQQKWAPETDVLK